VIAWAGASPTSGGPGHRFHRNPQGLKGRNNFVSPVPPLQGGAICLGKVTWGFTPGYDIASLRPFKRAPGSVAPPTEQRRIVADLDALQAEVDALKRLQAETAAELDVLLPAILDRVFKGKL
jgi:hypothetical protein